MRKKNVYTRANEYLCVLCSCLGRCSHVEIANKNVITSGKRRREKNADKLRRFYTRWGRGGKNIKNNKIARIFSFRLKRVDPGTRKYNTT